MKRFISLLLGLILALTFTACGKKEMTFDEYLAIMEKVHELPASVTVTEAENPITYFNLSMGDTPDTMKSLLAYPLEDGVWQVEYTGDVKKVGKFTADAAKVITAEMAAAGLDALNGQSVYEDGEAMASMFISLTDESMLSADFSGKIPQEFTDAYNKMAAVFASITAELPEYIPQPQVMDGADAALVSAFRDILIGCGMPNVDTLVIMPIANDEFFADAAGLASADGVKSAASCAPMMMATAYSFVIVDTEEGADIAAIRDGFKNGISWNKWVCATASHAVIAQKGSLVLCMYAEGDMYTLTAAAIEKAGWESIETITNPDYTG